MSTHSSPTFNYDHHRFPIRMIHLCSVFPELDIARAAGNFIFRMYLFVRRVTNRVSSSEESFIYNVNLHPEHMLWLRPTDHIRRRPRRIRSNANESSVDMILIPGMSTSTSGRSIYSVFKPIRLLLDDFLANSIHTGVYTEQLVQLGFCAFHYSAEISRHYTRWAYTSP